MSMPSLRLAGLGAIDRLGEIDRLGAIDRRRA